MGYQVGILQASSMGYNVYRRIGFQDFGKLSLYLWEQHTSDNTRPPIRFENTDNLKPSPV